MIFHFLTRRFIPSSMAGKAIAGVFILMAVLMLTWLVMTGRPLAPWTLSSMPNLAAVGDLPSFQNVMETNPTLRERVRILGEHDEGWLFANYGQADKDVAAILLLWAGADMTKATRTAEGLDSRIDTFLRKVYGMGPDDYLVGDPLVGDKPWVRWFVHFKPRLLIQMAGMRVYKGSVAYDPVKDKMVIDARLSSAFLEGFTAFVQQQPDPAPYINNLVAFIDATAGLESLSKADKQQIKELIALRP